MAVHDSDNYVACSVARRLGQFDQTGSIALLLAATRVDASLLRVAVLPSDANGLRERSQITITKPIAVRRDEVAPPIGRLDAETMLAVTCGLAVFLGIAWPGPALRCRSRNPEPGGTCFPL